MGTGQKIEVVIIDIIKTFDDEYKIIEVNSGVMMENLINLKYNGREIAKEIYRKVINFIFNVNYSI